MKTKFENINNIFALIAAAVLLFFFGMVIGLETATPETVEVVKYVEVVDENRKVDTSIIENNWDGNFSEGNLRMLSAWYYSDGVIEDEQGELWAIDYTIDVTDFLLIWVADNHTPDEYRDDIIVKIWAEVYE